MSTTAATRKPKPAQAKSARPAAKPAVKPAGQPAARPAVKPAGQPAARPAAKPAAEPAAQPTPQIQKSSSKPHLKLVPKSRPRFRKLYFFSFMAGLVALVVTPFAIVLLHVSLLTGQRQLDDLRLELNQQLELRQQLLYDHSQAVSPERIRDIATEELGMVPAENITYLQSVRSGADG